MERELIINNVLYAKYILEGNHVFLKMIQEVEPESAQKSEDWLIMVIQGIEHTKIEKASYLNV